MKAVELEMMYREEGLQKGIQQGIEALILDNLEEHIPRERIIAKLQRRFELSPEKAEMYYERFSKAKGCGLIWIRKQSGIFGAFMRSAA